MKLIDRDKFINDMFDLYLDAGWNPQDVHFSLLDVRPNIDSPEYEVEAIPFERIRQYKIKLQHSDYFGYDDAFILDEMIKEWKKENDS